MFQSVCGLFVISLLLNNCIGENDQSNRERRDSYLSAYHETHDLNEHADNGKVHYVDATSATNVHPVYVHNHLDDGPGHEEEYHVVNAAHVDIEHYPGPEHHYSEPSYTAPLPAPPPVYGPPHVEYNPPVNTYGPSAPLYPKKPPSAYGPPSPVYIPPTLPPVYIPQPPVVYGPPHHKAPPIHHTYFEHQAHAFLPSILPDFISPQLVIAILDKIKMFKVDLFALGKLILKFFIFKKIISFFTILFLLLVIPSLKHKGKQSVGMVSSFIEKLGGAEVDEDEDEDDDEASRSDKTYLKPNHERINGLTRYVLNAIESFENKLAPTTSTSSPMSHASVL